MAFSEVGFSVWRPCLFFLQSETVVQTKRRHFKVFTEQNFGAILAALARGFADRHFERGEGPGDEVEISQQSNAVEEPKI